VRTPDSRAIRERWRSNRPASKPGASTQETPKRRAPPRAREEIAESKSSGGSGRFCLVEGIDLVAEGCLARIENDREMGSGRSPRAHVLEQLPDHVAESGDRARSEARRICATAAAARDRRGRDSRNHRSDRDDRPSQSGRPREDGPAFNGTRSGTQDKPTVAIGAFDEALVAHLEIDERMAKRAIRRRRRKRACRPLQ